MALHSSARSFLPLFAVSCRLLVSLGPPIPEGTPAPGDAESSVILPVTAAVGGRAATVQSAVAMPGQVGIYQVQIALPAVISSGPARLTISVDGNSSQSGVTIQIQ